MAQKTAPTAVKAIPGSKLRENKIMKTYQRPAEERGWSFVMKRKTYMTKTWDVTIMKVGSILVEAETEAEAKKRAESLAESLFQTHSRR